MTKEKLAETFNLQNVPKLPVDEYRNIPLCSRLVFVFDEGTDRETVGEIVRDAWEKTGIVQFALVARGAGKNADEWKKIEFTMDCPTPDENSIRFDGFTEEGRQETRDNFAGLIAYKWDEALNPKSRYAEFKVSFAVNAAMDDEKLKASVKSAMDTALNLAVTVAKNERYSLRRDNTFGEGGIGRLRKAMSALSGADSDMYLSVLMMPGDRKKETTVECAERLAGWLRMPVGVWASGEGTTVSFPPAAQPEQMAAPLSRNMG
jgi:hypothetical protein